jgi:hypothetical protein
LKIEIKKHLIKPNKDVIEVSKGNKVIATIYTKEDEIKVISKYIERLKGEASYPPVIKIKLKELK